MQDIDKIKSKNVSIYLNKIKELHNSFKNKFGENKYEKDEEFLECYKTIKQELYDVNESDWQYV